MSNALRERFGTVMTIEITTNAIALRLATHLFDRQLIQNQYRSAFIEAMLEPYLASRGWEHLGDNWCGWDFEHTSGMRLEVKQSAAWQTWDPFKKIGAGAVAKSGQGIFDIAPRTGWFDKTGAVFTKGRGRPANVYVFAWNGKVGETADHRDPDQWEFFIVPAADLPAEQQTIGLASLRKIVASPFQGPERCAERLTQYMNAR